MGAIMATEVEKAENYEVSKLTSEHLSEAYEIYMQNCSIYDENLEMRVLNANTTYSETDFIDILQDDKTIALCVNQKLACQQYCSESPIYINLFKGFLVYEILEGGSVNKDNKSKDSTGVYSIVFLEVESQNKIAYYKLLGYLKERIKESKRCSKIEIEIEELRDDLMKAAFASGFKETNLVKSTTSKPDNYIFEWEK